MKAIAFWISGVCFGLTIACFIAGYSYIAVGGVLTSLLLVIGYLDFWEKLVTKRNNY